MSHRSKYDLLLLLLNLVFVKLGYLFMASVKGNFGVVWPFLFLFEGIRKVFEVFPY